jgi:hypothetical protein
MTNPTLAETFKAVMKVGEARGFLIAHEERRLIITAAHCLPHLPPAHPASYLEERTYPNLLGELDDPEPKVWAECLFADPIADLAVLGEPDGQELWEEHDAFEAFAEPRPVLRIGPAARQATVWVLQLDGRWTRCMARHVGGPLWLEKAEEIVTGGMSGSPIVTEGGMAVGAVSRGNHANPCLAHDLPARLVAGEEIRQTAQRAGTSPGKITFYEVPPKLPPGTVEV